MYLQADDDGEMFTPERLRREGLHAAYEMQLALRCHPEAADEFGRTAIAKLVEAFLADRSAQSDLFAAAHRIGRELSRAHGCYFPFDETEQIYHSDCPIDKLHTVVATSLGWIWEVRCSICDAEMFGCDHVPGEEYGRETCSYRNVSLLRLDHAALTADPDFPYTWITDNRPPASRLLAAGQIAEAGETLRCRHCETCYGLAGARTEDLDPVGRWQRILNERDESERADA
jgi:hypothetical protein